MAGTAGAAISAAAAAFSCKVLLVSSRCGPPQDAGGGAVASLHAAASDAAASGERDSQGSFTCNPSAFRLDCRMMTDPCIQADEVRFSNSFGCAGHVTVSCLLPNHEIGHDREA